MIPNEGSGLKRRKVVFGSPLDVVIQEEEIRQPSSNEVLVKTVVTLVSSGTEMTAFRGNFPPGSAWAGYVRYPFTPGYSNVAKVVKVGKRAGSLAPGDLVFSWAPHCSHAVLSKDAVTKIPAGMNVRDAVFGTLGQIALNGIRLAEIALGDCVIVAGLGPLGQLALQCARLCGAYPLVAVDLFPRRLEVALGHGADHIVNAGSEDVAKAISEVSRKRMADVVIDVTGNQQFIPQALKLLKRRGKLVVLGSPRGPVQVDFHNEVHSLGLRIIGAHNSMHTPVETPYNQWTLSRDLELFFDLLSHKRITVADLVTHEYRWQDAPKAYAMLHQQAGDALCVLFDWRH